MKLSTPRSNLDPIATTVKFTIDTSPPGRVQPTLPTGTQGEEGYQEHGIVVPPPLVGLPGFSEELVSTPQKSDHHSTTMVRVPGSSGDSGIHRESLSEDVKLKTEPGMEVPKSKESPQRVSEIFPVIRVFGGALVTRK